MFSSNMWVVLRNDMCKSNWETYCYFVAKSFDVDLFINIWWRIMKKLTALLNNHKEIKRFNVIMFYARNH